MNQSTHRVADGAPEGRLLDLGLAASGDESPPVRFWLVEDDERATPDAEAREPRGIPLPVHLL